jgi:putative membrane protein insertion efficiency factor
MKIRFGFIIGCAMLNIFWSSACTRQEMNLTDNPTGLHADLEKQKSPLLYPFKFYKDYISSIDGDRCPMYPTCSQYCMDAIDKHGSLFGWIMCSDRLMRCGRDETKLSGPVWINNEKRSYDPVSNNDFWRQ